MNTGKKRLLDFGIFLISTGILVAFDQWTKALAVANLKDQADIQLISGVLCLHYLENTGAAFGIFQDQRIFLLLLTRLSYSVSAMCYGRFLEKKNISH